MMNDDKMWQFFFIIKKDLHICLNAQGFTLWFECMKDFKRKINQHPGKISVTWIMNKKEMKQIFYCSFFSRNKGEKISRHYIWKRKLEISINTDWKGNPRKIKFRPSPRFLKITNGSCPCKPLLCLLPI